jgi:hypothetical protein
MAFARAPASLLAPMSYTQMIWAVLAGVLVFGDAPDLLTLLGMAVVAAGGVLVVLPERARGGPPPSPPRRLHAPWRWSSQTRHRWHVTAGRAAVRCAAAPAEGARA